MIEILRGVVGSTAYGLAIEGSDDRDEMGIFVEPPERVCGMTPLDHVIQRDAKEGERSRPGDLDLTLYSLRKFARLATKGSPSVLALLWLPSYITKSPLGDELIDLRSSFVSKSAGEAFLGYLRSQRMKLTGERTKRVSRPELVAQFGYDTKFAMHALRLGHQGCEFMRDGHLTIPLESRWRETLRQVRLGKLSLEQVLDLIDGAEAALVCSVEACEWRADITKINKWLVRAHFETWDV